MTHRPQLSIYIRAALEELSITLSQRGDSYADFEDNSRIAVGITELIGFMQPVTRTSAPQAPQINAASLIATKLSRLADNPKHLDSWLDIAGYAILAHATTVRAAECENDAA